MTRLAAARRRCSEINVLTNRQKFLQKRSKHKLAMRKQKTPSELGFTYHDIRRLRNEMKVTQNKGYYQCLQSVLATAEGMSARTVRELTCNSMKSIFNYVNCYLRTHQIASLNDEPRTGQPMSAPAITDSRSKCAVLSFLNTGL